MSEKRNRQAAIKELIANQTVPNQESLVALLEQQGLKTTQTTLSRDLNELGIWKGPGGYVLSDEVPATRPNTNELRKALRNLVVSMECAANLLIIKTQPGRAQTIGYELDNIKLTRVVGNISGDDTVFVATPSDDDALELKAEFEQMKD